MRSYYRLLLFVLLIAFMLILLVPWRRKEDFAQPGSTIDLYQRSSTHNEFIKRYDTKMQQGVLKDRHRLLHMRGCYQFEHKSSTNILGYMIDASKRAGMKVERLGPKFTSNFNDIEVAIQNNVAHVCKQLRSHTKNPNAVLRGEVYVMVMQAPHYKSSDGGMMAVQFNIDDYAYMPVNLASGSDATKKELDFEIFVIYANYKKNMERRDNPLAMDEMLMRYRTNHEQCKITCANNPNLVCGCKTGSKDEQGYPSKCLTARLDAVGTNEQNKAVPHDFPILYVINRQNDNVLNFMSQVPPKRD